MEARGLSASGVVTQELLTWISEAGLSLEPRAHGIWG